MEKLQKLLKELGQEHILEQIPDLSKSHPIYKQLDNIDLVSSLQKFELSKNSTVNCIDESTISPVDNVFNWENTEDSIKASVHSIGLECISQSKVGAVILSGGQGTRLGYAGPKGMYKMGLLSDKSIFQIHIERIIKIKSLAHIKYGMMPCIPIYIMTSDMNDEIIRNYFNTMNYFGYPKEDIYFFEQGLELCISLDGKIIIDSLTSLSLAPDGNGGTIYWSFKFDTYMYILTHICYKDYIFN